jgi:hypothetical protein
MCADDGKKKHGSPEIWKDWGLWDAEGDFTDIETILAPFVDYKRQPKPIIRRSASKRKIC